MTDAAATMIWQGVALYGVIGLAVAAVLALGGLTAFDRTAAASPFHFKLVILPGVIALWPVMVVRLLGGRPAEDRRWKDAL